MTDRTYHADATAETWQTPTVPYSLTDAVNRAALATGSVTNAARGASADYNGKRVEVDTGIRSGWRAHYTWAGLRWITRGASFESALASALRSPEAKAKGGLVRVSFSEFAKRDDHVPTDERRALLRESGLLPRDEAEAVDAEWRDWRYDLAHEAIGWERRFGPGAVSVLLSMTADQTPADYHAARRAYYDGVRSGR